MDEHKVRLKKLRELIVEKELSQLLVSNPQNVRYMSGFTGSNGTLLVGADDAILLTDFRYTVQAAEQAPAYETLDGGSEPRKLLIGRFADAGRIGFDDADMRVKSRAAWLEALPEGIEFVPADGIVEKLRMIKDDNEIDAIARAAMIGDSIYASLAENGLVGRNESEIAWQIEVMARERGASGLSFPSIVAAGSHGALPHAEPRDRKIEKGELVTLDLGVICHGYCSDCTRTFATGPISDSVKAGYELVLAAQLKGLEAITAGVESKAVDAAARDVIEAAGKGELFGHSTGHGVGIEVHELPTLSARSESTLEAGNVVTVEPGVYVPGEFGVRIEDLVVVSDDGPRVLTPFSKELLFVD